MPKQELNPKNFEAVSKVCEAEGLDVGYIVCRATPVVHSFVAMMDAWTHEQMEKCKFYAPILDPDKGVRLFYNRDEAEAYAERKTKEIHEPYTDEDGRQCISVEIVEMTDYLVVPIAIAKSATAEAEVSE